MRQSQVDLRRSVWALRSRAAEQFNLTNALRNHLPANRRRRGHPR